MSAPEPKIEDLRVEDIVVRDRLRPVTEAGVESLLASIREIGAIKDEIHVRLARRGGQTELRLLAGGHRLEAARRLGWETIRAKVWRDIPDTLARLIEVDDNLAGAEMNALDTSVFLAVRKRVYEELHPETRHGGDRKGPGFKDQMASNGHLVSFVDATAEKFGLSPRQVRRMVFAGEKLSASDVVRLRRAPKPVTLADLQVIAKIGGADDRVAVVEALAEGRARSAGDALKRLTAEPAPKKDPAEQQMLALGAAWSRASAAGRKRWIADVFAQLAPMVAAEARGRHEAAAAELMQLIDEGGAE